MVGLNFVRLISRYRSLNLPFLDQALVSATNFLLSIFLTSRLGLESYGLFVLYWTCAIFLSSMQQALIISPMLTLGPKESAAGNQSVFGAFLLYQVAFSIAALVLVLLGTLTLSQWGVDIIERPPPLSLSLAVAGFLTQDFMRKYFLARNMPGRCLAIDIVSYGGQIVLIGALAWSGSIVLESVLFVIAVSYCAGAMLSIASIDAPRPKLHDFPKFFVTVWQFSKWLLGAALLQWASGNLFILSAGYLLGPASVGVIRAAQNIAGVLHVFFIAMENIIPVKASLRLYEKGRTAMLSLLKEIAMKGGAFTTVVALLVAANASSLLELAYGMEMSGNSAILIWFAALYILVFFSNLLRYALRTLEETRAIFVTYLMTTLFSAVAAYPLIHFFGIPGVMIGITGSQIIMFASYFTYLRQRLGNESNPSDPG